MKATRKIKAFSRLQTENTWGVQKLLEDYHVLFALPQAFGHLQAENTWGYKARIQNISEHDFDGFPNSPELGNPSKSCSDMFWIRALYPHVFSA
jgi:hypothetical protein